MAQLARGTDAFGLIFDNLLGFDLATTRRLTNLYALLYDALIVSDSWCMTNAALQAMLRERDGLELLHGGVVVPVLRDSVDTFSAFLVQARGKNMHSLCASDGFAKLLGDHARRVIRFSFKEVVAAYTAMAERVLAEDVLARFGVVEASAAIVARLLREARDGDVDWKTNTWVKDFVCPHLPEEDAALVMEIARAPYGLNLPVNVLHSGIAGPDGFRGDQILAALTGESRTLATVGTAAADAVVADAVFRARVGDALVNWLLSSQVLEELTAADLVRARESSDRQDYLTALTVFLSMPDETMWKHLVGTLERYLRAAAGEVFDAWRRDGRLQADPPDGQIIVEGATTIRIMRPDKPVELAGVIAATAVETRLEVKPVQVIGRTLVVPRPPDEAVS